jgi:hypothetical protein
VLAHANGLSSSQFLLMPSGCFHHAGEPSHMMLEGSACAATAAAHCVLFSSGETASNMVLCCCHGTVGRCPRIDLVQLLHTVVT